MPKYLIEVKHGEGHDDCVRALQAIEQYGSHYLTHAEWGCKDGIHCAWLIADLESRQQAMQMVPADFRKDSRIVQLNRFTKQDIASLASELDS